MNEELKPCPVCKSTAIIRSMDDYPYVWCNNKSCMIYNIGFTIKAWNTRPESEEKSICFKCKNKPDTRCPAELNTDTATETVTECSKFRLLDEPETVKLRKDDTHYTCSDCNIPLACFWAYCPGCGKVIDWSDKDGTP